MFKPKRDEMETESQLNVQVRKRATRLHFKNQIAFQIPLEF